MEIKKYTSEYVRRNITIITNPNELPFIVTRHNKPVCAVVSVDELRIKCEACGQQTPNEETFFDRKLRKWRKISLCNQCKEKFVHKSDEQDSQPEQN